ncbi:hypothetical protein [Streptomyces sp. JV178]|uniref:hypothetical protein n=1 Tax=Streptomyces sp. JV178 TaxID=858632 RepID=UPI0015D52B53|nr:hypothetical protein [Streptomyces sp. JV178]
MPARRATLAALCGALLMVCAMVPSARADDHDPLRPPGVLIDVVQIVTGIRIDTSE